MSELNYKELQEKGIFDVPFKAFQFMQEQQSEIDQLKAEKAGLEKRMHKAISKWVAITSIVTTQRNGLPDEFYQKLDQLHDVLTGFDEALRGEHE